MSVKDGLGIGHGATRVNDYLRRISRLSAWALLVVVIVLVVSGWGMTHTEIIYKASFGLIDRGVANSVHRAINIPVAIFLLTHVLINIKLGLLPRFEKTWLTNGILVVVGIGLLILTIYMEYFA